MTDEKITNIDVERYLELYIKFIPTTTSKFEMKKNVKASLKRKRSPVRHFILMMKKSRKEGYEEGFEAGEISEAEKWNGMLGR